MPKEMDLPHSELLAPTPVHHAVSDAIIDATVVAIHGKAKDLERLGRSGRVEYLWISGVDSRAAQVLGSMVGLRRLVIHDLRVPDLRHVAALTELQDLAIAGSVKLKSLSGLEAFRHLRRLILFNNCNYTSIDAVAGLSNLETLCLEGGFSKLLRLPSLAPLRGLHQLERLRLASLKVADGSLRALHDLRSLRTVFIAKAFTATEFGELASALPEVRGEFVDSFRRAR